MEIGDLKEQLDRNPYAVVAGAIGVGFVLGGGLFTRLTARLVGAGLRMGLVAALPLLKGELQGAGNHNGFGAKAPANEGERT